MADKSVLWIGSIAGIEKRKLKAERILSKRHTTASEAEMCR